MREVAIPLHLGAQMSAKRSLAYTMTCLALYWQKVEHHTSTILMHVPIIVKKHIYEMLQEGIIVESTSPM